MAGRTPGRSRMRWRASVVVIAGRPAGDSPSPWLETEHDGGIGLAVEHVVELGQERIALLAGPKVYDHVQRRLAR